MRPWHSVHQPEGIRLLTQSKEQIIWGYTVCIPAYKGLENLTNGSHSKKGCKKNYWDSQSKGP